MVRFDVWAPRAGDVALEINGQRMAMAAGKNGYWTVMEEGARAGDDYAFVLDGGPPLPDPRSMWQPHGVHGPSRLVDHSTFSWTDEGWSAPPLKGAVIYELHVGTFTEEGTFEGAIARLDYLRELGVTHVELMPIAEFPGAWGWGYDGVHLYAPKHSYGGPVGLKRLVDACHQRGLGVLLDVVYNHLGPDGNYLPQYGPYFTDDYETPWGQATNLDGAGSDAVRRFLIDNALMWLRDYHVDGLRLDASDRLYDMSPYPFLEELAVEVQALEEALGRRLILTAENDLNDPRLVRKGGAGGYGLDAHWLDDFHHALHSVLSGEVSGYYKDFGRVADLAATLQGAYVYAGRHSVYRGHRRGRRPSLTPGDDSGDLLPGERFVVFMQNHDQVGNRAVGDRLGHVVDTSLVKAGAALTLLSPFAVLLFQGEEWGASSPFQFFTDHQEPELARAVSVGRQSEFGAFGWAPEQVPDPQDVETFRRSKLKWAELAHERHRSLLDWYRRLIALRREHPALQDSRLETVRVTFDEDARWLVMQRGTLVVACFFGEDTCAVQLPRDVAQVLMASDERVMTAGDLARFAGPGVVVAELAGE